MNIRKLTWMTLTALALSACTDENMERQTVADGAIRFVPEMVNDWNSPWTTRAAAEDNVTVQPLQGAGGLYLHKMICQGFADNNDMTRGTKYTSATFAPTETFYVSGYRYAGNSNVSTITTPNFLSSTPITYVDSEWKATEQNYVMPASTDLIDFFAWFMPTGTSGVTPVNAAGGLQLTYTMPSDISEQPDLLTAVKRNESYSAEVDYKVELAFTHQLTEVNFVLDENVPPATITEIAFINVYTSATLNVGGVWDFTNGTAPEETKYTLNFSTTGNDGYIVGEESRTILSGLMMIPQEFSNTQKIRIKMHIDGEEQPRTLYADLKDTEWENGTTVTYKISASTVNTLRINEVSYPTSWGTQDITSLLKNDFTPNDALGIYAVDADGEVVLENVELRRTSSGWDYNILYTPGLTYFAYYPYRQAGLDHGTDVTSAETFFAAGIGTWKPSGDQSDDDAEGLDKWDLQVAKGTFTSASTVSFSMARQMNLATLKLGDAGVGAFLQLDANYKWLHEGSYVTASSLFDTNKPYLSDGTYYYVFAPVATASEDGTVLRGLNSDNSEDWNLELKSTQHNISPDLQTVYTNKTASNTTESFTLATGDIYYSNGAISHSLNSVSGNANYSTPIGVVAYSGSNTGNDTYQHGLVIAMENASENALKWTALSTGTLYNASQQSSSSFTKEDGSVYRTSRNSDNWPAFKACINYTPEAPAVTTGWFLPSGYQMIQMKNQMGGFFNLRDCFASRGGTNMPISHYWTCSERNGTYAWYWVSDENSGTWNRNTGIYKTGGGAVRAVLAF